ncbi:MAG: TetR/AcrR family transcriptional regulator [Lachnospiraceae bacterium]|nr:TetR/AcrR family transcriptional regulator [Lachnospiraceae bacterium]
MGKKPAQAAATKQKLIDAFWSLYTQKGIEQISIKEITDLAGCNRGTFYLYFRDIYDMLGQIEDALFHKETFPPFTSESCRHMTLRQIIEKMAAFHEKHRRYILVLLGEHGDPQFAERMKRQYMLILAALPHVRSLNESARPYYIEYCCSGILSMIRYWLKYEPQLTVADFILTAIQVILPESAQKILDQLDSPLDDIFDFEHLSEWRFLQNHLDTDADLQYYNTVKMTRTHQTTKKEEET